MPEAINKTIVELGSSSFIVYDEDNVATLLAPPAMMTDDGLQLGAKGTAATVSRQHVSDVVGADEMSIAFTLDADMAGTAGGLFRLHGSFLASVDGRGELQFRMFQQDGSEIRLSTSGAKLNDGAERDVVINLEDGRLQLWVDGNLSRETAATGPIGGASGYGSHGLTFGNPWGKSNFNGDLKAFEINVGAEDTPMKTERFEFSTSTMLESLAF